MNENKNESFWQTLLGSRAAQVFVGMILGGLLMLVVVRFLYPNASSVQITLPGGKTMGVSVESNQVDYQKFLQEVFDQENVAREGILRWLKEKHGIYQIKDPTLINELSGMLPDKPKDGTNETFQQRTERLQKAIEEAPTIKQLRDKANQHDPPFQFIGEIVKVKFNTDPPKGKAYVPNGSHFAGKVIEIFSQSEEKQLTLRCEERISGVDGTKVLLNRNQFAYLFGGVAKGKAEAVVLVVDSNSQLSDK